MAEPSSIKAAEVCKGAPNSSPMAHPNSVKVVEVFKVAPQPRSPADSATPPPPESLPLTFFDLLWLRFSPVERLFFYEINHNSSNTHFSDSVLIPKLKASLSIALQHFLPLAGNVIWPQNSPKPILSYVQGDAVSLTIAESDADFCHLVSSNNVNIKAEEYHPLVPQLAVSHERAAAVAFQVTIFPNRGFCIGTSMHHAILDGMTSTMFVKSWAHICKHENSNSLPDQLKPLLDRSVVQDTAGLEPIFLNQLLNMDSDGPFNRSLMFADHFKAPAEDTIRGTFVFTREKIEALRQSVKEKKQQQHGHQSVQYLSTFCVTCAYVWICLLKAKEIQIDRKAEVQMGFTVDCRSRLDPSIPATYFGNCLTCNRAVVETKAILGEDGLIVAVNAISEAIKRMDTDGVLGGLEILLPIMYSTSIDNESLFSVAGSPRFGVYGTDFGWGRPKKVEIFSIEKTGAMSLSESKDGGGGVEVGLVLKKHHMEAFSNLFAKGLANI